MAVSNGVFSIDAGSINSLTKVINFTNALYMEVIIINSTAGDQVLTPRLNITSAPFAIAAEKASTNFNLNKYDIINASNIYASGTVNGIIIDNSSQSIAGVSSILIGKGNSEVAGINSTGGINGSIITVQKSGSIIGSISKTGVVNGSSVQVEDNGILNDVLSPFGITIKSSGGSTVGGISSAGVVNGSSVQVESGGSHMVVGNINSTGGLIGTAVNVTNSGSKVASISKTGVVNGSSVQVESGGSHTVVGSISSTGTITASPTNTINGIIISNGAISGITTLSTSGNITTSDGLIISGGHLVTTGPTPTITGCGTPEIFGTDNAGNFTINTASTTAICTITFKSKWSDDPVCLVNDQTSGAGRLGVRSSNQTAITISTGGASGFTGDLANYICMGAK